MLWKQIHPALFEIGEGFNNAVDAGNFVTDLRRNFDRPGILFYCELTDSLRRDTQIIETYTVYMCVKKATRPLMRDLQFYLKGYFRH